VTARRKTSASPTAAERDARAFAAVAVREAWAAARRTAPARRANAARIAELRAKVEECRARAEGFRAAASLPDAELARQTRERYRQAAYEQGDIGAAMASHDLMKAYGLPVPELQMFPPSYRDYENGVSWEQAFLRDRQS
jgi:hypothetical protein